MYNKDGLIKNQPHIISSKNQIILNETGTTQGCYYHYYYVIFLGVSRKCGKDR